MKQAVLVGVKKFEVRDVEEPIKKIGEVLIKVEYVGVCGSDLHVYTGHHPKVKAPVVSGHEFVGTIFETEEGSDLKVGMKVTAVPYTSCGECIHCKLGEPSLCYNRRVMGFQTVGAQSEIISVPVENVIVLPEGYESTVGALLEPLSVIIHAVSRVVNRKKDQQAFVTGAGPIGLITALYLQDTLGVDVTMVEINKDRIELANELGCRTVSSVGELNTVYNGKCRPMVFECTGNLGVFEALEELKPAPSDIVIISTFPRDVKTSIHMMCRYETKIHGTQMYTKAEMEEAVKVLNGDVREKYRKLLVKRIFTLEEVGAAFEEAIHSTKGVKVLIKVN